MVRALFPHCQAVRPSLFDRARSSTWPPGQEIPFDRQLADLGVKLGRLTLALLLAIARTARPSKRPRQSVDLVDDDHVDLPRPDIIQQLLDDLSRVVDARCGGSKAPWGNCPADE